MDERITARVELERFDELLDLNLPALQPGADIDIEALRVPGERVYNVILLVVSGALAAVTVFFVVAYPAWLPTFLLLVLSLPLFSWMQWQLVRAMIRGHALKVTSDHFPQVYASVKMAADAMRVQPPEIYVLQGHGIFDVLVARRYTRRGLVILTSNMMDHFAKEPTSREFMFLIGRQLGHIRAGHFDWWWLRDSIGQMTGPLHAAWMRRAHLTADRVGLMVAGDPHATFRSLSLLTVGAGMASSAKIRGVREQARHDCRGFWTWLVKFFSGTPFMVHRMIGIAEHARAIQIGEAQGVFAIDYPALKQQALVLIHGHDELALLQLKDFLREAYPLLDLRLMRALQHGALSMPEKFEMVANGAVAAIALMTPDDYVAALRAQDHLQLRARQNVIMEIGWFWARLGRDRVLLLSRGEIEVPSDFSGVEVVRYAETPRERCEELRTFLSRKLYDAADPAPLVAAA